MEERIFLRSGARELTLPSGDKGLYFDLCIEDLYEILRKYDAEDIKRPWISKSDNKTLHNIRIFAIPKQGVEESSFYPYYLEVAKIRKKE